MPADYDVIGPWTEVKLDILRSMPRHIPRLSLRMGSTTFTSMHMRQAAHTFRARPVK